MKLYEEEKTAEKSKIFEARKQLLVLALDVISLHGQEDEEIIFSHKLNLVSGLG